MNSLVGAVNGGKERKVVPFLPQMLGLFFAQSSFLK